MTLGEIVRNYLEENNLSYREFAKRCKKVSFQYVQMIVTGINPSSGKPIKPSIQKLVAIAEGMGTTAEELIRQADEFEINISGKEDADALTYPRVPIVGEAAAGEPIYSEYTDEYIDTRTRADCAIVVKGDSMFPKYLNGDLVYIRLTPDIAYEGQIAVVIVEDEACIKKVYHIENGLRLKSVNPAYPDIVKTFGEYSNIRILGTVCGFTRFEEE